jgi:dihydroorotate dehydrogenase (NAD+) catalytic subunit
MADTSVRLGALTLKNPIIPASGTFGYGMEYKDLYDLNLLGAISVKGTTLEPRFGNPLPRIAEAPAGLLNAVGLQNPGIQAVLSRELPALAEVCDTPILLNIGGFSLEEYETCARLAGGSPLVSALELNISCPNVHGGGAAFGTDPALAAAVTRAVRRASDKPLFVKLSPNVTDITEIARACEAEGADGLSLINTVTAMRIDLKTRKPILANGTGGLSGPGIFPLALRMVWQVCRTVDIPVLGMGGVTSAEDVLEMVLAGASAVQVGSANLIRPTACRDLVLELPALMDRLGIKNLDEIRGAA